MRRRIDERQNRPARPAARARRLALVCVPALVWGLGACAKDTDQEAPEQPTKSAAPASKAAKPAPTAAAENPHAAANPHAAGAAAARRQGQMAPKAAVERADGKTVLGGIAVAAPDEWTAEPVSSSMRRAQWKIAGDDGPAELVVYYFGPAGAGSVERNLERWYGQFAQPDGRPSKEVAEVRETSTADMKVTRVEVGGPYVAAVRPGAAERHDIADARMLAAIIEAPDGAYYFKMVGPASTVKAAAAGFDAMLGSLDKNG